MELGDTAHGAAAMEALMVHHPDAFVTLTRVTVDDANRDAVLEILREIVALDATEPGTLVQTVQVDEENDQHVWLYELWASPHDRDLHRDNGAELRGRLAPLISVPFEVITCRPLFGHGLDLARLVTGE
ncbi:MULTISPECIES: putative quinol monooxygenase [Rhodococcus]|nr:MULTISPECIES: antibiotic biosynthesis monooxygenase [Rhodococcus]